MEDWSHPPAQPDLPELAHTSGQSRWISEKLDPAHLSPDTEMRCLQSLLNFMPVTISVQDKEYSLVSHSGFPTRILLQQWRWGGWKGGQTSKRPKKEMGQG